MQLKNLLNDTLRECKALHRAGKMNELEAANEKALKLRRLLDAGFKTDEELAALCGARVVDKPAPSTVDPEKALAEAEKLTEPHPVPAAEELAPKKKTAPKKKKPAAKK